MAKMNLGNAEQVSSMTSSDSYLIETGGSIRRLSGSNALAVYDSDGNVIVDTYKKKDTVVLSKWSTGSGWMKFASHTMTASSRTPEAVHFRVTVYASNSAYTIYGGGLSVYIYKSSTTELGNVQVVWDSLVAGFDASNVVAAYNGADVELWMTLPENYQAACITLIHSGQYNAPQSDVWDLYNCNTLEDNPTEGYTQVAGTLATLQNPIATTALSDIQTLTGGVLPTAIYCLSRRTVGCKASPSHSCERYSKIRTYECLTARM